MKRGTSWRYLVPVALAATAVAVGLVGGLGTEGVTNIAAGTTVVWLGFWWMQRKPSD